VEHTRSIGKGLWGLFLVVCLLSPSGQGTANGLPASADAAALELLVLSGGASEAAADINPGGGTTSLVSVPVLDTFAESLELTTSVAGPTATTLRRVFYRSYRDLSLAGQIQTRSPTIALPEPGTSLVFLAGLLLLIRGRPRSKRA